MKRKILMIDNYDSFVYNLVHYLQELGCEVLVKRNDQIDLALLHEFDEIVLSPGPGIPEEAGLLKEIIKKCAPTHRILGVCLGHQAIAEVFGAELKNLPQVFHGIATTIEVEEKDSLFTGLGKSIQVGRYHSWVVDPENLPQDLEVTAQDEQGQIMALRHKSYDLCSVQFHPESVLTPKGMEMLQNWLNASEKNA
jgi:anthranilate synthase component 2